MKKGALFSITNNLKALGPGGEKRAGCVADGKRLGAARAAGHRGTVLPYSQGAKAAAKRERKGVGCPSKIFLSG